MDAKGCLEVSAEIDLEHLEKEGIKTFQEKLKKLYSVWNDFGIGTKQKLRRAEVVWIHVQNLLEEIYKEESDLYKSLQENVKNYIEKIEDLSRALSIDTKDITGSLVKREELLRAEFEKLNEIKQHRLKSYKDLKSTELKYCKILGIVEHQISSETGIPSQDDLNELEQRIIVLREERDRKHRRFCLVKKDLTTILETTELPPETSLEKNILSDQDNFSLSDNTMKNLEEALDKAQQRKAELEARKKELMSKLLYLCERLNMDERTKVEFITKYNSCSLSTLKSIEVDVEKCELLRKENIDTEISFFRKELEHLWTICCAGDRERQAFHLFSATEMTDVVLEAHEVEVEKWRNHHKDIQHILDKINRRQHLWDKLAVFENKATDPNRFRNRGGNLLKEEKERKMLQKELPNLENDIIHDIETYEVRNKTVFTYYGEDFRIFITNQWDERADQKENEKAQRQLHRLAQAENETTMGTPLKRSLMKTPKSTSSKLLKTNVGSVSRTPGVSYMMKLDTIDSVTPLNRPLFTSACKTNKNSKTVLQERQKLIKKGVTPLANSTTYSDFIGELNTPGKSNHQSSILEAKYSGSDRILRSSKTARKRNMKTFQKSPRTVSDGSSILTPTRGRLGLPFII